jgi:AbrB family transcriptional regulator (stage V sporulation protein T)
MKATGIVRRIDDLGRIVVPKEIRRTLRIREGCPLEIYTDKEGHVILKKYSPVGELGQFAEEYVQSLAQTSGHLAMITDCERVVAASGRGSRHFDGKEISGSLIKIIEDRKNILAGRGEADFVNIIDSEDDDFCQETISVILSEGDAIGAVILCTREETEQMSDAEAKLAAAAAGFLGRQMET